MLTSHLINSKNLKVLGIDGTVTGKVLRGKKIYNTTDPILEDLNIPAISFTRTGSFTLDAPTEISLINGEQYILTLNIYTRQEEPLNDINAYITRDIAVTCINNKLSFSYEGFAAIITYVNNRTLTINVTDLTPIKVVIYAIYKNNTPKAPSVIKKSCTALIKENFTVNNIATYTPLGLIYLVNGIYFTKGYGGKATYYSTDGKNWSECGLPSSWYEFYYINKMFYAFKDSSSYSSKFYLYYSTDGKNWTKSFESTGISNFKYINNTYYILNYSSKETSNMGLYYSTDGKNWTQCITVAEDESYNLSTISIVNSRYFLHSDNVSGHTRYSTDGKNWSSLSPSLLFYSSPVYYNGKYYGINKSSGGTQNTVFGLYYSTDGKNWTASSYTGDSYSSYKVEVVNNILYLLYSDSNGKGTAYYSTDGTTFTSLKITSGNTSIRFINNLFILTTSSQKQENSRGVYYSTNGKTWTASNITTGSYSLCNIYVEDIYLLSGTRSYSTGLYYSTDGKNWTASNITTGYGYKIQYINGVWFAISGVYSNTTIYYSIDGKHWDIVPSVTGYNSTVNFILNKNELLTGSENGVCSVTIPKHLILKNYKEVT